MDRINCLVFLFTRTKRHAVLKLNLNTFTVLFAVFVMRKLLYALVVVKGKIRPKTLFLFVFVYFKSS